MDATIATGAAAIMAIRILLVRTNTASWHVCVIYLQFHSYIFPCFFFIYAFTVQVVMMMYEPLCSYAQDHDVKEENILFVSILASKLGVHSVAYAFPRVKIITSALDSTVDENFHILPGVGNYGDRYFGTGLD